MNETPPAHTDGSPTGISGSLDALYHAADEAKTADEFIVMIQRSWSREKMDLLTLVYNWELSTPENVERFKSVGWFNIAITFFNENHHVHEALSDSEIEQLSQQEALPEGWTEFSEHETAFQKIKRTMKEQD